MFLILDYFCFKLWRYHVINQGQDQFASLCRLLTNCSNANPSQDEPNFGWINNASWVDLDFADFLEKSNSYYDIKKNILNFDVELCIPRQLLRTIRSDFHWFCR